MTLAPNYRLSPEDGKVVKIRKNRNAESAVTRYRRLASSAGCSLLELQPITGEAWIHPWGGIRFPHGSRDATELLLGPRLWEQATSCHFFILFPSPPKG